nr:hypothetical protein [Tanacetum cinerariifolium]
MGGENSIHTLEDNSKPSHEGYRNTIELPPGNNVMPLRSDTIRLVQNGCSFYGLRSEDPSQHLKDLLKLMDSLDLDPQALRTTFEARVRDYMASHTEGIERFKNAIFKQREEINDRMTEIFRLLKELTTSKALEKNANDKAMSSDIIERPDRLNVKVPINEVEKENEAENRIKNEPIKSGEKELTQVKEEESMEAPSSQPIGYYLKHRINEKLIKGLVENHRFNDSLSAVCEDIRENFEIPCNIGGLKHMNALVDQGFDVNVMPLSTYKKLTEERHAKTNIRLSLASHSYIYPLGIAEDVLVDVAGYVYPVDFVILDIKEDEKRPFILGTSFLTTTKA